MESLVGPDFGKGVPIDGLPDGGMIQGKVGDTDVVLGASRRRILRGRSQLSSLWWAARSRARAWRRVALPYIMPASVSARERPCVHRHSTQSHAGASNESAENVFVREQLPAPIRKQSPGSVESQKHPASVVIVGGGAAGLAAADMLRREGATTNPSQLLVRMISAPYDRPNLSKDYLAGTASDEWIPLRSPDFYAERHIDLVLNSRVASLDAKQKRIQLEHGKTYDFGALLLATGADPVKLPVPGASDSQLHYLRTFADSRTLAQKAASAKQVVVVGASFIALEVAASLRARGIAVHVVAPEQQPLVGVMGPEVGRFISWTARSARCGLPLGRNGHPASTDATPTLSGGVVLDADFLVWGVGVRPSLAPLSKLD